MTTREGPWTLCLVMALAVADSATRTAGLSLIGRRGLRRGGARRASRQTAGRGRVSSAHDHVLGVGGSASHHIVSS